VFRIAAILSIASGCGLAAFGISAYNPRAGWFAPDQARIAVGVAVAMLGVFLRKELK